MGTLVISFLTLLLLIISAFVVLVVLMQRTSQNGGMGAALGGGAAESAFGSDTNNILTKATIYGIIAFFVVALGLYLFYQSEAAEREASTVDATSLISAENTVVEESVTGEAEAPIAPVVESMTTVEEGTNPEATESTEEVVPTSEDAK